METVVVRIGFLFKWTFAQIAMSQDTHEPLTLTVLCAKRIAEHLLERHERGWHSWQLLPEPLMDLLLRCLSQRRKFSRFELALFVPLQGLPYRGPASIPAKLTSLDFSGRSGAQAWLYDADVAIILRACTALRHLSLQGCQRLSTPAIISSSLVHLDLSRCSSELNPRINCPNLLFLAMDMKMRILKKQLQGLSVACPRLEHLRLARLSTDELFLTFPATQLHTLDLSHNPSLRVTGLSALASLYPRLHTAIASGSPLVAEQLRRLRAQGAIPSALNVLANEAPQP